jgi:hypothetical protein
LSFSTLSRIFDYTFVNDTGFVLPFLGARWAFKPASEKQKIRKEIKGSVPSRWALPRPAGRQLGTAKRGGSEIIAGQKSLSGSIKKLTFLAQKNILPREDEIYRRSIEASMNKLTEAEIAWLMSVLTPGDCKSCIWREQEEERYRCFRSGDSPCKVFVDKVFQGLERADLI